MVRSHGFSSSGRCPQMSSEQTSSEQTSSERTSSERTSSEQDRWRAAVPTLHDDAIDHVVVVQCELSWLLGWSDLRDELDEALLRRLLLDRDFRVTRLVWHDIPAELVARASAPADAVFGEH